MYVHCMYIVYTVYIQCTYNVHTKTQQNGTQPKAKPLILGVCHKAIVRYQTQ